MTALDAVEKLALELPEPQRAMLAAHMLHSLPALFTEPDQGIAEAERRNAEMDFDPTSAISLDELDEMVSKRRVS